jgi:hypothetical protein
MILDHISPLLLNLGYEYNMHWHAKVVPIAATVIASNSARGLWLGGGAGEARTTVRWSSGLQVAWVSPRLRNTFKVLDLQDTLVDPTMERNAAVEPAKYFFSHGHINILGFTA